MSALRRSVSWMAPALLGIAGGFVGGRLSSPPAVHAQVRPRVIPPQRAISAAPVEARGFVLMDEHGRKRGELGFNGRGQPTLRFFDESGKVIWTGGAVTPLPLAQR